MTAIVESDCCRVKCWIRFEIYCWIARYLNIFNLPVTYTECFSYVLAIVNCDMQGQLNYNLFEKYRVA